MKICILAYTLATGGFTSSLLPLIKQLKHNKSIEVELMLFSLESAVPEEISDIPIKINNTPKKDSSTIKKIWWLITTPTYIKHILKLNFLMTGLYFERIFGFLLDKTIGIYSDKNLRRFKKKLSDHEEKINRVQGETAMAFSQSLVSRLSMEYTECCDLSEYDCVVSWEECFCNYFLAEKVRAKRKIGYVHPDYQKALFVKEIDERYFDKLDGICFVSKATQESFSQVFPQYQNKLYTVNNLLDISMIRRKSIEPAQTFEKSEFDIVTVCRLDNKSKALNRGIRIIARLFSEGYEIKWYIVGEGYSRPEIENEIDQYNLKNVVFLLGNKDNPHPFTKKADLFMLQSYYEGKPMAVDEALIIGTPVLITNFAAAREQIDDGVTGYIAENDEQAIYEKLKYILEHQEQLKTIRKNLQELNVDKFSDLAEFLVAVKGR